MNTQTVAYQPSNLTIIDIMQPDGKSQYARETIEQIKARYPGAEVWDFDAAIEHKENALKSPPIEITLDQFIDALEVLPPRDWQRTSEGESFKMCEHTSGRITAIYAKVNGKYYTLSNVNTMPHADIMAACVGL